MKTILLRAHRERAFGTHYLGLSVITPVLPLAPSQKNVSRKLPRVHARKYIAIKLLRNIPITLTMTPHSIETVQSGVKEREMGTKEGDENSKPPSPKYSFIETESLYIPRKQALDSPHLNFSGITINIKVKSKFLFLFTQDLSNCSYPLYISNETGDSFNVSKVGLVKIFIMPYFLEALVLIQNYKLKKYAQTKK